MIRHGKGCIAQGIGDASLPAFIAADIGFLFFF